MAETVKEYTIKLTNEETCILLDLLLTDEYGEHNDLIKKVHSQLMEQGGSYAVR